MNSLLAIAWPISETAVERLGWILIHSLWQFTLVALLAAMIVYFLRHRSASSRYVVLIFAMTASVALPLITGMLQPAPALIEAPAENVVIDQVPLDAPPANEPVARDNIVIPADRPLAVPHEDHAAVPANLPPAIPAVKEREITWSERLHQLFNPYLEWIVAGWSLGVIICALRPLFGWYTLRRLKRVGTSAVSDTIAAALKRISHELGITRTVRVMQSTLARVPVVVGYFRPVILLPASLLTSIPPEQLEAILAHELAHVRRHDFIVNLLQTLIETLFFYHPAIWWMSRKIRIEREHCCDDLVISSLNNRVDYGRALVAIEELRGERTVLALGAKDGSLLSRVRRIVGLKNDRPDHFSWTTLTGLTSLCLILAGLTFLGWALIAQTNDKATTTVVMEWSAMVDEEVLKEIRDLTSAKAEGSPVRCSADELRSLIYRHRNDKDRVLLAHHASSIASSSPGFRHTGKSRSFSSNAWIAPQSPEKAPKIASWSGGGNIYLESKQGIANLRLNMTYGVFGEGFRSETPTKFEGELKADDAMVFVVPPGGVAQQKRFVIVVYEAMTIPTDQIDVFKMHVPTEMWCHLGADGLQKWLARAADWRSRPSTALAEPNGNWTRNLDHGGHVQLVALGRPQAAPFIWWTPDGKPFDFLSIEQQQWLDLWNTELAAVVRVWEDGEIRNHINDKSFGHIGNIYEMAGNFPSAPGSQLLIVPAVLSDVDGQPSLKIGAGFGESNEETTVKAVDGAEVSLNGIDIRVANINRVTNNPHAAFFWTPTRDVVLTAVAVTANGKELQPLSNPLVYANEPPNTKNIGRAFRYPEPNQELDHFIIKSRPCQWVEFTDFAVEPAARLNPPLDFDNPDGTEPTAKLPDNITVKLVGVGYHPSKGKEWWAPDGGKLDKQPTLHNQGNFSVMGGSPDEQAKSREFLIHIAGLPKDHAVHTDYGKSAASGSTYADGLWVGEHAAGPFEGKTTSFRVGLTTKPFGPTVTIDASGQKIAADLPSDLQPLYDRVAPKRVKVVDGKTTLVLDGTKFGDLYHLAAYEIHAVDRNGDKIDSTSNAGYETETTYGFRLPLDQLDHFEYRMRPYRHWVTFKNVSLEPGVMTEVKVKVESIDLTGAEALAKQFLVAIRRQNIPFLNDAQLEALSENLESALAVHITKPIGQKQREQLATAVAAFVSREFKPADSDYLYLNFENLFQTLKWSLAAAITRGDPTPEQAQRLAVQRDWMRAEILKLPESAKYRLSHAAELVKLEPLFADPLNPFLQEPMTDAEFAQFQSEYGDRIARRPSETRLNAACIYLFAAAFDVLRERLLPLRVDVAERATVFVDSEKTRIDLIEGASPDVELKTKIVSADSFDPKILHAQAITPYRLRIKGLAPGATSAVLLDEENRRFTIDVHVVPSQQVGFRRSNFSFSLNVTRHGSAIQPNDLRQSVSDIYADVINNVFVPGDAPADMSARAAWLEEKKLGDLAYDGTAKVLLGVRGAKLAVLDAKSWYEADRVSTEELKALIKAKGKSSLSMTHFAEPVPSDRPASRLKKPQPSLIVRTREGRMTVIRLIHVEPTPFMLSRPRPESAAPKNRPGGEQGRKDETSALPEDLFARPVSLTANNMPLREALRKLAEAAGVPLQLDIVALAAAELDLNTPVTVTIVDEPLEQAMLGLIDWNVHQGVIRELRKGELIITTIAARKQRIEQAKASLPEEQRKLLKRGVHVEFDDDGQVVNISAGGASAEELLSQLNLFPHLRELKISGTKSHTIESLAHLSELTELQKLSLSEIGVDGVGLGDVALKQIAGLKSLREISLLDCGVTDEGIRHLEDMPWLTRLEINGEGRLTDAAVASIAKLTRLTSLSLIQYAISERLGRMHFSSQATSALAELQELEHLNLVGQGISADSLRFPRLKSLALGREHIDDAHAKRIAECRELRTLTLVLTDVGDDGLNLIADLSNLRSLDLKSDVITDAGIAHLSRLTTLDHIQLYGTKLTDDSLRRLAEIETLTRIDLNSGKYTVNGVSEFKALPKLRTLWLTNFTAQGSYSALNELTQLRELVFESADITQDELNALQEALPNTQMRRGTGGGLYLPDSKQKLLQVKPILEPSTSNAIQK